MKWIMAFSLMLALVAQAVEVETNCDLINDSSVNAKVKTTAPVASSDKGAVKK